VALSDAKFEQALELVGLVYRQVLEPGLAQECLNRLALLLGSRGAQMYTYERASGQVVEALSDTSPANEKANRLYLEQWGQLDPRPLLSATQASGTVLRCHNHFSEQFVAHSPFYQEFFIPNGFRWALGGMLHHENGTSTVIASVRAPDQGAYEGWTQKLLTSLLPHFQQAAGLRRRVAEAAARRPDVWGLIEHLPLPAFVVDSHGELLEMNAAALDTLKEMPLIIAGKFVRFSGNGEHACWLRALSEFGSAAGVPQFFAVKSESNAVWKFGIVQFRHLVDQRDAVERGLCLVFAERVGGPSQRALEMFAQAMQLTAAESEILAFMLRGLAPKQIASKRLSSINTVRSQIAAILSKCSCNNQRELSGALQAFQASRR
jgi:DNA-binding CsgD family transcriptional regulator